MYVVKLNDLEILGVKIVCAIRSDKLAMFDCSSCNNELQKRRNCRGDSVDKSMFFNEDLGTFYTCPLRFISLSVQSSIDKYDYYEKYPSAAPEYERVNPRYWEFVKVYEATMRELSENNSDSSESKKMLKMKNSTRK